MLNFLISDHYRISLKRDIVLVSFFMPNPLIKLKFDQELDQDMAWSFYSNPKFGGCNFWEERALAHHPKLLDMVSSKDHKKFLNNYIDHYYKSNSKELKDLGLMTSEYLNQSEDEFFKIIDDLFKQHPWPKKEFTGVFSIFDFCPRFLTGVASKPFSTTIAICNFSQYFTKCFILSFMILFKNNFLKNLII